MANSIDFYRLPAPVLTPTAVAGGSLVNGTTYYYLVKPIMGIGTLPGLASSYDTVVGNVSNEVSFTADAVNKSCRLNWTNPDTFANGYHIFRSTTAGVFPDTSHLATIGNVVTYTDTGIATAALSTSYSDQINVEIPMINVKGYYYEGTVPAGTPTVTGNVLYLPAGSFVVDSLKDRVLYWSTDRARFTDDSGRVLRYAKIKSNSASSITFYSNPGTILPIAADAYKISWNMDDVYAAFLTAAPAVINALMPYDQAGQPVIVKNRYKNWTINATLAINRWDASGDFAMFSVSRDTIEFGQLCRFKQMYQSAFYCGNCSTDLGSGEGATMIFNMGNNTGDTMQNGCDWFGAYDIGGLRFEMKAKYITTYGNDSLQPQWSAQSTYAQACYRHCGSTFIGTRAVSPSMGTIFLGNQFLQANGPESSFCETNGMAIIGALTNGIRPGSTVETRNYNTTVIGGGNAMDMYAYDSDSAHLINPAPQTLTKCLGSTVNDSVHWETTPNAGTLWIDYQLGFNVANSVTSAPIQDAIVEVFDKNGSPLYADIVNRFKLDREHYIKGTLQSSSQLRNIRSAWYPIVSVPEYRPALYVYGRYYAYQNTEYKIVIADKGASAGQYGSYVSPQLTIPSTLQTGYVQANEGEILAPIDKAKTYLFHMSGDVKYAGYIGVKTMLAADGLGVKTGADESLVNLPTGYSSTQYANHMRIEGRRFLTDATGRIPLLDFKALSIKKGPTHSYNANIFTYLTPWTIKISKVGYKTQQFKFTPAGLYEKEFNISLEPLNYKSLKLINVRKGVSVAK